MQANPPQLHSNLLYIQRYRRQSRLVAEAAYFFTNMLSAESFISNIDAQSLSMEETEFEKNMELAQTLLSGLSTDIDGLSNQSDQNAGNNPNVEHMGSKHQALNSRKERDSLIQSKSSEKRTASKDKQYHEDESPMAKIPSLSDIENRGATVFLKDDLASQVFREYPYLFARVGDLTVSDVEDLLNNYKQLVFKYACLSKGLGGAIPSLPLSNSQSCVHLNSEIVSSETEAVEPNDELHKHTGMTDDSNTVSLVREENVESNSLQDEAIAPQVEEKDGTSK